MIKIGAALAIQSSSMLEETVHSHQSSSLLFCSSLPDVSSWKDYFHQYWNSDPQRYQYRLASQINAEERKKCKRRLPRMNLMTDYVQDSFQGNIDSREAFLSRALIGELTTHCSEKLKQSVCAYSTSETRVEFVVICPFSCSFVLFRRNLFSIFDACTFAY